jgi:hypothetical protein
LAGHRFIGQYACQRAVGVDRAVRHVDRFSNAHYGGSEQLNSVTRQRMPRRDVLGARVLGRTANACQQIPLLARPHLLREGPGGLLLIALIQKPYGHRDNACKADERVLQ